MKIELMDLKQSGDYRILNKLQPIIDENLVINGGTLKQGDILKKDYDWSHVCLLKDGSKIVGFVLLRLSYGDEHSTNFNDYYYISTIALYKAYQGKGYGTKMMEYVLNELADIKPIVASVFHDNVASLGLFNKVLKKYGTNNGGKYLRFMDEGHFNKRYDSIIDSYGI